MRLTKHIALSFIIILLIISTIFLISGCGGGKEGLSKCGNFCRAKEDDSEMMKKICSKIFNPYICDQQGCEWCEKPGNPAVLKACTKN